MPRINSQWKIFVPCLASLVLWMYSVGTTQVSTLSPNGFLGILFLLPVSFWLSLGFGLIAAKNACESENPFWFVVVTILLTLILYTTYPIIEPAGRHAVSYEAASGVKEVIQVGGIPQELATSVLFYPYYVFPGFLTFMASLTSVSGINLDTWLRYFPAFLVFSSALTIFLVTRTVARNNSLAMLGALLSLSLNVFHTFFVPELLGGSMLAIVLYLIMKNTEHRFRGTGLALFVGMSALTITHPLNSLALLLFVSAVIIFGVWLNPLRGLVRTAVTYFAIFLGYLIYAAEYLLVGYLPSVVTAYLNPGTLFSSMNLGSPSVGSTSKLVVSWTSVAFYLFITIFSAVYLLKFLTNRQFRQDKLRQLIACYLCATPFLALTLYGGEIFSRMAAIILLGSIPAVVSLLANRKVLLLMLCILVAVQPIAFAGSEAYLMVTRSELAGTTFFSDRVAVAARFFSQGDAALVYYAAPTRLSLERAYTLRFPPIRDFDSTQDFTYLIYSGRDANGLVYYGRSDLIEPIRSFVMSNNVFYSNGYMEICLRSSSL